MDRRTFLKLIGSVAVAAVCPIAVTAKGFDFDPMRSYADFAYINEPLSKMSEYNKAKTYEVVETHMRKFIPEEYWDKVTYIEHQDHDLFTLAWKYRP